MVSEPYASMYDDVALPPPAWREDEMANKPYRQQLIVEWDRYGRDYPGEMIDRLRRIYWGMVSCIDDWLGRLRASLEESGLAANTLVLFTSDHGDELYDLQHDPDELYNLADYPRYADVAREHRDHQLRWEIETEETLYHREKAEAPA